MAHFKFESPIYYSIQYIALTTHTCTGEDLVPDDEIHKIEAKMSLSDSVWVHPLDSGFISKNIKKSRIQNYPY
jgi:hypothetical protein